MDTTWNTIKKINELLSADMRLETSGKLGTGLRFGLMQSDHDDLENSARHMTELLKSLLFYATRAQSLLLNGRHLQYSPNGVMLVLEENGDVVYKTKPHDPLYGCILVIRWVHGEAEE